MDWTSKNCQRISVIKTNTCDDITKIHSSFWHFNSRFVLKTTETRVFMFSLLRLFWHNNWRSMIDVVERLGYCGMVISAVGPVLSLAHLSLKNGLQKTMLNSIPRTVLPSNKLKICTQFLHPFAIWTRTMRIYCMIKATLNALELFDLLKPRIYKEG